MSTTIRILIFSSIFLATTSQADTVFSDDFQDGNYNGWSIAGQGRGAITNYYAGNYSIRLRRKKNATQSISTAGYSNVQISTDIAASSLEGSETCVAEVSTNGGGSWTAVNTVVNGQDNGYTMYTETASPSGSDDNANFQVRLRANGNQNSDYCYFDNIIVTGDPGGPPPPSCDYDCLDGDGNASRSLLTYSTLLTTGTGSAVDLSAFSVPTNAANPSNTFEGELSFNGAQLGWQSVKDSYNYASITDIKKLPDFDYEFVQHGTHLIPVDRGLTITSHYLWQLILEPGRVWDENSDSGYSRAALPFSLQEYGANCTHNGVLTFLFKDDGSISSVAYQISSETCEYYKFNLYGRLAATYSPASVTGAAGLKTAYEDEVSRRMPIKPITDLATDYPGSGINTSVIGSEQTSSHLSAFGVAVDGVHYTGGCGTRHGTYPYCDVLDLPSYSVSKSTFGGIGLMAVEHSYTGAKNLPISTWVSGCSSSTWGDVTWEDALDMATGNYTSSGFEVDESSTAMLNGFFLTYTDSGKTSFSCSWSRKATPGTLWVYHTSDTYLLGKAMDTYLGQDTYGVLVDTVYEPLGLSPTAYTSVRTFDTPSQPMTGFGLTYHRDDLVKLAELINTEDGVINGTRLLDDGMVDEAMQRTAYHGLDAGSAYDSYDNGFWIWKADAALGCSGDRYIPYMSGFGGIAVVLLPNDMVYYFVSDNNEHTFVNTALELDKIGDFCN